MVFDSKIKEKSSYMKVLLSPASDLEITVAVELLVVHTAEIIFNIHLLGSLDN